MLIANVAFLTTLDNEYRVDVVHAAQATPPTTVYVGHDWLLATRVEQNLRQQLAAGGVPCEVDMDATFAALQ